MRLGPQLRQIDRGMTQRQTDCFIGSASAEHDLRSLSVGATSKETYYSFWVTH